MYGRNPPMPERGVDVSIRGTRTQAECPFCGQIAVAVAPQEGGLWYVTEGCSHCKGIYSAGRWDIASITFKGPMTYVTVCYCGARMASSEFTNHKKTAEVPSDHAIVEEMWVDRL